MRFKLGAMALSVLVSLAGVEFVLRAVNMGYGSSPEEPDPFLHHVHPRNYTFVQRDPSGEFGGFDVDYNADGRIYRGRSAPPLSPPPPATPSCRVAIMGDSFAEGEEVPYDASYAALLESAARERCEVRNYATRSYSPAIYLVQWTRDIATWKPTDVFLMIYSNDVSDDRKYLATAVMGPDGFPVAIRGPLGGWLTSQLRRLYIARYVRTVTLQATWAWEHRGHDAMQLGGVVEENPDWTSPTTDLVLELSHRIHAAGAHFVLTVVPSRYKLMGDGTVKIDKDLHQKVKEWAADNDVEFLDLDDAFQRATRAGIPLFYRRDIHFNVEGNAVTAAVISRAFPSLFSRWADITSAAVRAAYPEKTAP